MNKKKADKIVSKALLLVDLIDGWREGRVSNSDCLIAATSMVNDIVNILVWG